MTIDLTVITPTYNEQESILGCIQELRRVMMEKLPNLIYEHIIIDNNSTDNTINLVRQASLQEPNLKIIVNSRNIGASRSIYRALARASGAWIVPMLPADLQDPPELIPKMLEKITDNVEVVYGVRSNREENIVLRNIRRFYYRILTKFSDFDLQNDAGEFCLISRRISQSMISVRDENPYIRGLIAQSGAKSSSISYIWKRRMTGKSKSTFFMLVDVAISGMVSTTYIPARIAMVFGFFTSFLSLLSGLIYLFLSIIFVESISSDTPTIVFLILFTSGIQLFFLGLIGEYVLNIHRQIKPEVHVFSTYESGF